jgi:hypothetical protein
MGFAGPCHDSGIAKLEQKDQAAIWKQFHRLLAAQDESIVSGLERGFEICGLRVTLPELRRHDDFSPGGLLGLVNKVLSGLVAIPRGNSIVTDNGATEFNTKSSVFFPIQLTVVLAILLMRYPDASLP